MPRVLSRFRPHDRSHGPSMVDRPWRMQRFPFGLRWWHKSLIVLGFWTLVAGIWIGNEAVSYARLGRAVPWPLVVAAHGVEWGSWALMTPLVYLLVRWRPARARTLSRSTAPQGSLVSC